jgi:hypothetical protein
MLARLTLGEEQVDMDKHIMEQGVPRTGVISLSLVPIPTDCGVVMLVAFLTRR